MNLQRLLIAGGGTGGHIYPGVAIAEEVRRRNPDAKVVFVGTARGLENRILPPLGYPLERVTASRLKGGNLLQKMLGLLRLPGAMWQSWRLLRRHRPEVVIGVGGYASGPALLAAWLTGRRTAIQEQNAAPGLTNRWLGRVVRKVFVGFAAAAARFPARKVVVTGNPLRHALSARLAAVRPAEVAAETFSVLVFGGSQGARFLNERVPPVLAALARANRAKRIIVMHQTGESDLAATEARYQALADSGLSVDVKPFIHDMPNAYAHADIAVCRAGALTLAELAAVGLPALLVPFPHAADNHQEANARVLEKAGAAKVMTQSGWSDDEALAFLSELLTHPERRQTMRDHAAALGQRDAARLIVDALEGLAA
jgi:UDP-N-acetylglucosamine--N-acetylmuramyl-(pentapeptide) pyrophosphoryl-undecaprenol N-acetylglucosamine transferase